MRRARLSGASPASGSHGSQRYPAAFFSAAACALGFAGVCPPWPFFHHYSSVPSLHPVCFAGRPFVPGRGDLTGMERPVQWGLTTRAG